MPVAKFQQIVDQLRSNVTGTKAIVLIGPDGILDRLALDQGFDLETFATEYATLLRIASRTADDTGAGNMVEHIVLAKNSATVARCFADRFFLILVSDVPDQIGRARYEVKRAAAHLERTIHARS